MWNEFVGILKMALPFQMVADILFDASLTGTRNLLGNNLEGGRQRSFEIAHLV